MRRSTLALFFPFLLGLASATIPARAACVASRAIQPDSPAAGTTFATPTHPFTPAADYPYAPFGGSMTYYSRAWFWSFGSGNPAIGAGNDSGLNSGKHYITAYYGGVPTWFLAGYYAGKPARFGGVDADWSAPSVDGCITEDGTDPGNADAGECMVMLLNDLVPGEGSFAILSSAPDAGGDFTFGPSTGFPATLQLADVPRPTILATRGFGQPEIELTMKVDADPTQFGQGGFYLQCHAGELLVGYKLYSREFAFPAAPPLIDDRALQPFTAPRSTGPWVELTDEAVPVGQPVDVAAPCSTGGYLSVAATLVFGGVEAGAEPYELAYLSEDSSTVDCGPQGAGNGMGRIPATLRLARSGLIAGDLTLSWQPSCSPGAEGYAIYEGTLGSWYSHSQIDCSDDGGDGVEEVAASVGDRYYLVVPNAGTAGCCEGSYGFDSAGSQRPRGQSVCNQTLQVGTCGLP